MKCNIILLNIAIELFRPEFLLQIKWFWPEIKWRTMYGKYACLTASRRTQRYIAWNNCHCRPFSACQKRGRHSVQCTFFIAWPRLPHYGSPASPYVINVYILYNIVSGECFRSWLGDDVGNNYRAICAHMHIVHIHTRYVSINGREFARD